MKHWGNHKKALQMEIREHKSSFIVYLVLRALVLLVMVLQILNKNYENVFYCILTLLLLLMPSMIQVQLKIELPTTLEIIILLFIFAAEVLGEIGAYYTIFPHWDTILHTINGFLAAAIGFSMVDILNREEKFTFRLSPMFMAIVAFCFSMTIGVLWEFFEFGVDYCLGMDMQKDTVIQSFSSVLMNPAASSAPIPFHDIHSTAINGVDLGINGYLDIGLIDTMEDLIVNFIGAVIFSIVGYFYVKTRGKGWIAQKFIPRLKTKDADFLRIVEEQQGKEAEDQKESQTEEKEKPSNGQQIE